MMKVTLVKIVGLLRGQILSQFDTKTAYQLRLSLFKIQRTATQQQQQQKNTDCVVLLFTVTLFIKSQYSTSVVSLLDSTYKLHFVCQMLQPSRKPSTLFSICHSPNSNNSTTQLIQMKITAYKKYATFAL